MAAATASDFQTVVLFLVLCTWLAWRVRRRGSVWVDWR